MEILFTTEVSTLTLGTRFGFVTSTKGVIIIKLC